MIKVLIVDDSALVRSVLTSILNHAPDIEVVGVAADPFFARDKFKKLLPDVITLDVEMPRMDGLTFLEKLMSFRPTPVIMISSLTEKGAQTTLKALQLGAVDFVAKPAGRLGENLDSLGEEIVEKVRGAAKANLKMKSRKMIATTKVLSSAAGLSVDKKVLVDEVIASKKARISGKNPVICVGASTGGTVAIETILTSLPPDLPGIAIVQHMPPGFTKAFADRVNGLCHLEVVEGENGMKVEKGSAIVAPGGMHMMLTKSGAGYIVEIKDGPPVNRHKPSVDVLFRSAANTAGSNVLGVILTGMGDDGARGMKDLHDAGAYTVAQDEKSCVVFGMPKVAIDLGAVDKVMPLDQIPHQLMNRA